MKVFNVITTSFGLNQHGTDCIETVSVSTWPTEEAAKKAMIKKFCELCAKYAAFIEQIHLFETDGTIYFYDYIGRSHDECNSQISVAMVEAEEENI